VTISVVTQTTLGKNPANIGDANSVSGEAQGGEITGGALYLTPQTNAVIENSDNTDLRGKTVIVEFTYDSADDTGVRYFVDNSIGASGFGLRVNNGSLQAFMIQNKGTTIVATL